MLKCRWRVVRDRQGGDFAMGKIQTAAEWLEDMTDWQDADNSWGDEEDARAKALAYWQKAIEEGREDELIEYIGEVWDLDFDVIDESLEAAYEQYKSEFDPAEGEPADFLEWLDNEAVILGLVDSADFLKWEDENAVALGLRGSA